MKRAAMVVALGFVVLGAARTLDHRVRATSARCAPCHAQSTAWQSWQGGDHPSVACGQCHRQGLGHVVARRLRGRSAGPEASHAPTPFSDRVCRDCHVRRWRGRGQIAEGEGHARHAFALKQGCLTCHQSGNHSYEPKPDLCATCHRDSVDKVQPMAREHCLACHTFLAEGGHATSRASACEACHEARGVKPSAGRAHGTLAARCDVCHQPHGADQPGALCTRCHTHQITDTTPPTHKLCANCHAPHEWQRPDNATCRGCHKTLPENVPAHSIPGHAEKFCRDCHPPHSWKFAGPQTCTNCHRARHALPHPTPWVPGHVADARAKRDTCRACHEDNFCGACHSQRRPASHATDGWVHGGHGPASEAGDHDCTVCHSESFCANCHARTKPSSHQQGDWLEGRHGEFSQEERQDCAMCHRQSFCADCHGLTMPHPSGWIRGHGRAAGDREVCANCHERGFCAPCHGGPNFMPPDHSGAWVQQRHGQMALAGRARCARCHPAGECAGCHGLTMPHPKSWLPRGHAKVASFASGSLCFKCHARTFCYRSCHVR